MTRSGILRTALVLALGAMTPGCAEVAFSPHFPDNDLGDLQAAVGDALKAPVPVPRNGLGKPLVFIVTKAPTRVLAYDLSGDKVLWSVPAEVSSKITVGRDAIFFRSGASKLEARRMTDGQLLWATELLADGHLMGMAVDAGQLFYVLENRHRESDGTVAYLVALSADDGKKQWARSSVGRLGAPVARGGRVLLPLRFQSIAILDAQDGKERARIRSKEETLSWVQSGRSGILYGGSSGVYRLDQKSVSGTRKESSFVAAALPQSVRPVYWWDGYNPALAGYTAYDRNRLLWQLAPQRAGFLNNLVVVHNYRFFFGFDAAGPESRPVLRWAYSYPRHDVVASALTPSALLLVTAGGDLLVLDPQFGTPVTQRPLKLLVQGATFDAEDYVPPAKATAKQDLRRALSEVIWDPDRRFGAVKLFCVEQLAELKGGRVAEDLVKIVSHEGIDPAVYKKAGEMIVARHDAASIPLYLATLKSHYSFVEGTRATAVDIMAHALGDLKAPEAVRPLLLHLADHETPLAAMVEIVRALLAIGDKSVVEPLRDFLLTYRCDQNFEKVPEALRLVAETLLAMGGENERQLLGFVENDIHTLPSLRTYLTEALRQGRPGKKAAPSRKGGEESKTAVKSK